MQLLTAKKELKEKTLYLEKIKTTYPFDLSTYLKVADDIEALEEDINRVMKLREEFGFKNPEKE